MEFLLQQGAAHTIDHRDTYGNTALSYTENPAIISLLEDYGAIK